MKNAISTVIAASFCMSSSAQVVPWSDVRDDVLPLQVMMGAAYEDFAVMHEIFGPMWTSIPTDIDMNGGGLIVYSIPPDTMLAGQTVSLSGQLERLDGSTWTGFSGVISPSAVITSSHTVSITENGEGVYSFELVGERTTNGIAESFLEGWTLEWSPGGGFAVSTHTSGALDRVTLRNVDGHITYDWRITKISTAEVSGIYDATTGSFVRASGRIPAPATLAALGRTILIAPRRR